MRDWRAALNGYELIQNVPLCPRRTAPVADTSAPLVNGIVNNASLHLRPTH